MTETTDTSKRLLRWLLVGLVLLLPLSYWLWYQFLEWIISPVFVLVEQTLRGFFPLQISYVSHDAHSIIVTSAAQPVLMQDPNSGNTVQVMMPAKDVPFDASIAGSGMPLFVALMLLASRSARDIARGLFIGIPLLWIEHAAVVVCQVLVHPLFFKTIVYSEGFFGKIADHATHAGNTLGLFVLPALFPIVLWILIYPNFVGQLVPALRRLMPISSDNSAS